MEFLPQKPVCFNQSMSTTSLVHPYPTATFLVKVCLLGNASRQGRFLGFWNQIREHSEGFPSAEVAINCPDDENSIFEIQTMKGTTSNFDAILGSHFHL